MNRERRESFWRVVRMVFIFLGCFVLGALMGVKFVYYSRMDTLFEGPIPLIAGGVLGGAIVGAIPLALWVTGRQTVKTSWHASRRRR